MPLESELYAVFLRYQSSIWKIDRQFGSYESTKASTVEDTKVIRLFPKLELDLENRSSIRDPKFIFLIKYTINGLNFPQKRYIFQSELQDRMSALTLSVDDFSRQIDACSGIIPAHCSGLGGYIRLQKTILVPLIFLQKSLTLAPPISAVRASIFKPRKLRTSPRSEFYHAYHFWGSLLLLDHASIRSMSRESQLCRNHLVNSGRFNSSVGPIKSSRSVKSTHLEQLLKKTIF